MIEDRLFTRRKLALAGSWVVVDYAALLAIAFVFGRALTTEAGRPARSNFLAFWSAGLLALQGRAAEVYDWVALHAVEIHTAGEPFATLPWVYPPTFLLVVTPLALSPYLPAFAAWMGLSIAAYLAAIHAVVPSRITLVLALASPVVFWNILTTQNGLLTAALMGGSLALMESAPIRAGVLLGLLTYKPQLGPLFPLVLALTGRWRVIASAAATAAAFAAASYLAFGAGAWSAFLRSGAITAQAEFSATLFPYSSLETVFGIIRWSGGGTLPAALAHGVVALAAVILVCWIWSRPVSFSLKAAALAAGSILVTPYLLMYDLAAGVTVSIAFLVKDGLATGFVRGERLALLLIAAALLYPVGFQDVVPLGALFPMALLGLVTARATGLGPHLADGAQPASRGLT